MKKHFLKSFALLAMLFSALTMSAATKYCGEQVQSTIDNTSVSIGVTILKVDNALRVSFESEHISGIRAGGTFQQWGNGVWANQADAIANFKDGWTQNGTIWTKDFAFSTYPTSGTGQIYCLFDIVNAGEPLVAGFTLTDIDLFATCDETPGEGGEDPEPTPEPEEPETPAVVYCDFPTGHLNDANFGDANGRCLLTLTKISDTNVRVTVKPNYANGATKKIDYLYVISAGGTPYPAEAGADAATGYDELSVDITYASAPTTYSFTIQWSNVNDGGRWQVTPENITPEQLCTEAVEIEDVNFALTANGSSAEATSGDAAQAIDNNAGSRWESASADPQTWTLDLGQARIFNTLEIVWEGAYGKTFTVSVSDDKATWTPVWTVEGQELAGFPYTQTQKIDKTTARYIQFHGTERGTGYGYSFWEFRVYLAGESVLTTLETSVASCLVNQNGTTNISLVAKNQNGVVMDIVDPITYTITPADAGTITNNVFTASSKIGRATIVATVGSVQSVPVEIFTYGNEVAPAPTRNAEDVIAFYSDTYTPVVNLWGKSQWNGVNHKEHEVSSNKYLHYSGGNWWGWEFGVNAGANVEGISSGVDCSAMEYLHIDIWGFENGTIRVIPIWGGTNLVENKALDTNDRYYALVEIRANQWNSVDIPLATGFQPEAEKHDFSSIFQFKFAERTTTAVAIDNVYFWKSAGTLPVESVTLDKTTATIEVEETLQLTANVLPLDAANKNVVWTSSDATVATVVDGKVTGLKEGTTTITATSEDNGEIKATCEITVEPITVKTWWGEPTTIKIEGVDVAILYSYTRNVDKTITYSVIFDNAASALRNDINVNLGDYNIMHDDGTGNNTAIWTSTTTHSKGETITGFWYIAGNRIDFSYIVGSSNERPNTAVTSVTLDKTSCDLLVDETVQLLATVNPGIAANKNVTWNSSNSAVAEVDANGLVTAKSAGNATITVTTADGGKTAQCVVTVSTPQVRTWWGTGKVTINGHDVDIIYSITHNLDKTLTYTVIFGDDTDMVREVNESSIDPDVYHQLTGYDNVNKTASYTSTTTHSSGEIITGFFWLGGNGVDFTYIVGSVNERPSLTVESVVLNHTSYNLLINETVQLSATITPGTAANKSVTWSSNNNAVATVDENGLVTAKSSGSATITVTTVDGNKTATCTINVIASLTETIYYDNAFFKAGENYVGVNYSITRTTERKLRYEAVVHAEVVGLVMQFSNDNGATYNPMPYDEATQSYVCFLEQTFDDGTIINGFFYPAGAFGAARWNYSYTVGSTNSPVRTMVGINDQEDNQSTRLAQYTSPVDVVLARSFSPDYWQTITLPFALNAAQITEIFGAGTQVLKLAKAGVAPDQAQELGFSTVNSIQASTPYLIKPGQNVGAGSVLRNVTLSTTLKPVTVGNVTMHPLLNQIDYDYTANNVLFFLGNDSYLHYQANNNTILGLRAYFTFDGITTYAQAAQVRARVVFNENEATGFDNLTTEDAPTKIVQNGQLIIIRDGIKYNVQGQVIR